MTTERTEQDFYAIEITLRGDASCRDTATVERTAYFKADRYSCYTGRLQVEYDVELGQRFKTSQGAWKAVDRLLAKGTIKPGHNPRVVRYTVLRVTRSEPVAREAVALQGAI